MSTTKYVFNPFTSNFDAVTATVSPSDVTGGTPNTFAAFDDTGVLSSAPGWGFTDTPTAVYTAQVSPTLAPTVTDIQGISLNIDPDGLTATNLAGFNAAMHVGDNTATSIDYITPFINDTIINANTTAINSTAFTDNLNIADGAVVQDVNSFAAQPFINIAALNSYSAYLVGGQYGMNSATDISYLATLNTFDTFGPNLTVNQVIGINLSPNMQPGAAVTSLSMISTNPQIDGVTGMNSFRGIELGVNFGNTTPTAVNNHIDFQTHPNYQSGTSLTQYTGLSISPSFHVGSALNNAQAINYNMEVFGTVTGSVTGLSGNNNLGNAGSPTAIDNYQDANFNTNFGADVTINNYFGLSVRPNVQGGASVTNNVTMLNLGLNSALPIGGSATGIDLNMDNFQTQQMPRGLQINNAGSQLNANFDTGIYPVQSDGGPYGLNNIGGNFHVAAGFPITGGNFGIGNNLGVGILIEDDVPVDSTGLNLGFIMNGFLTQVGVATGKTMASLTFMGAGASNAFGASGTFTEVSMYRALGILPGAGVNIGSMYGLKVEPTLSATAPANVWGVWVGDAVAENWMSNNLILGGSTGHASNSDIALEIGSLKAIKLPLLTTTQELALAPLESMTVYNATTKQIEFFNGTSWVAPAGSGGTVTSVDVTSATSVITTAGGPVTTSGAISLDLAAQTAGQVLAGPVSGGSAVPAFRTVRPTDMTLTNAHIIVGNGSSVGTDVAMSGDVTIANTGATTIANNAITTAKIAAAAVDLTTKVSGVLPVVNGGTGQSSYTDGQLLIGNTSGNTLTKASLTAGSGISITPGGGSITIASTALTPLAPTIQKFTTGISQTYTLPTSPRAPLYIRVRMSAGGGGGAGGGAGATGGLTGGTSSFGTSLISAIGGSGGLLNAAGGVGGTYTINTPAYGTGFVGGHGGAGNGGTSIGTPSGSGGSNPFGGGAGGTANGDLGITGAPNTGAGGSGGAGTTANIAMGGGGGAGGFVDVIIPSPSSTYTWTVGGPGTGSSAGTLGTKGGDGAEGYIEVTEYYQ